jgi:hypothetical protein
MRDTWTEDEDKRLLKMRRQGLTTPVIATRLGRTRDAAATRIRRLSDQDSGPLVPKAGRP